MNLFSSARRPRRGAVICGAYGMDNAGDDAVLAAMVDELRRIDRDLPITVLSRAPKKTAERFGVAAIHPMRPLRWLAAMRRACLFISGGGSLLQDVTSRRSLFYYLAAIRLARRAGCRVMLFGCGIGPLRTEASRRRTAGTLRACADVITVRDPDSEAFLRAIGVAGPRILLSADPALSAAAPAGERERAIGFVLRDWPGFDKYAADLAAAAWYAFETYRLTPVFLCLAPEDRDAVRPLCRTLENAGVPCSVAADVRRTGRMSLVLSMRLHGLIFALRAGTPAAGLSYDPKVASFCADAALPCLPWEDVSSDALFRLIDRAAHLDGESLSAALQRLRNRERVNASAAAELLSETR